MLFAGVLFAIAAFFAMRLNVSSKEEVVDL
jgi:hypothetical protein